MGHPARSVLRRAGRQGRQHHGRVRRLRRPRHHRSAIRSTPARIQARRSRRRRIRPSAQPGPTKQRNVGAHGGVASRDLVLHLGFEGMTVGLAGLRSGIRGNTASAVQNGGGIAVLATPEHIDAPDNVRRNRCVRVIPAPNPNRRRQTGGSGGGKYGGDDFQAAFIAGPDSGAVRSWQAYGRVPRQSAAVNTNPNSPAPPRQVLDTSPQRRLSHVTPIASFFKDRGRPRTANPTGLRTFGIVADCRGTESHGTRLADGSANAHRGDRHQ